jgi:hypothetical protein
MAHKYRVLSVQFVDVFATDVEDAVRIANDYYVSSGHPLDTPRGMRYAVTGYDYERGLDQDTLATIGIDIDDTDNGFVPINDPF